MIQEIAPHKYNNQYKCASPENYSLLIACKGSRVMCICNEHEVKLPDISTAESLWGIDRTKLQYLFEIDDDMYFAYDDELSELSDYRYEHILTIRGRQPMYTAFAASVGYHLIDWYKHSRFCGCCGHKLMHSETQRAMLCTECGNVVFPRINPIIIVAVRDGDKLLVAKYNKSHFNPRNNNYILLAGYVEIGESYEDTLRREVREETGLEVRNIRYAASQPWPFSATSIAGFYAEADSTLPLKRESEELAVLEWVSRDKLPARPNTTSITDCLIEWFRHDISIEELQKDRDESHLIYNEQT